MHQAQNQIRFTSDTSSEIYQYFKNSLPLPNQNLQSQMRTLHYTMQTQQNLNVLKLLNNQILQEKFNRILNISFQSFPSNINNLPNKQISQRMSQNLRQESLKDYSFNDYAICVQSYGNKYGNQNNLTNEAFTDKMLRNLLDYYGKYYSISPSSEPYQQMVNKAMRQHFSEYSQQSGIYTNSTLSQEQKKSTQIKKSLEVQQNSQILQTILGNTPINNQPQKPNEQVYLNNQNNAILGALIAPIALHNSSDRVNDKINVINSNLTNNQGGQKIQQKFNQSQFKNLTFYEYHMLNHLFNTINIDHCKMLERYPYIQNACDAINYAKSNLKENRNINFANLQDSVDQNLNYAMTFFENSQGIQKSIYYEVQSWMILVIHIYKCLADDYDPYRRRVLKIIFTFFSNQYLKNTVECLRWLENNRTQVLQLQPVESFLSRSRALIFDAYTNRESFLKDKNFDEVPNFYMINLSPLDLPRRKVVNIWVAGFLSEDMDKKSHWKSLTQYMPASEVYAIQWTSDKISGLVKFIGKACIDLLTADKMKEELQNKFKNNPFIPAMKVSVNLGRYLAEMLVRLFPNQFVNIVGYSLGSELIKACMERLVQIRKQSVLNNIYMLGGVTDCKELETIIQNSSYPWCLYNLYTDNDMVLKHVLSLCLPDSKPIGLQKVKESKGHQIINVDCSKFISGHLAYMNNFGVIGKVLEMNKQ